MIAQMRKIVELSTEVVPVLLYMMVKGTLNNNSKSTNLAIFDYIFDTVTRDYLKEFVKVVMDYPDESMEAVLESLISDKSKLEEALRLEGLRKR